MKKIYILLTTLILTLFSCEREFLAKSPDKALLVPTNLTDFRSLLDNTSIMNVVPVLQRISTDEYWVTTAGLAAYQVIERNCYLWAKDLYEGRSSSDWVAPYREIFYANIVLDGLENVETTASNKTAYEEVKGSALFYRAFAVFHLAQLFAKPFNESSADVDFGVPIPLHSDVNERPGRGTLRQTYTQMISDLQNAFELLPEQAQYKSRPSKLATLALLSRIYFSMEDYPKAWLYANNVLQKYDQLLDYTMLSTTSTSPFPLSLPNGNSEVLYHAVTLTSVFASSALTGYDREFYNSYMDNDLRKALFFTISTNNTVRPKNSYAGSAGTFAGIATDEIYLNRAECYARNGETQKALDDLNTLLKTRWKTNTFVPFTANNADEALAIIITERRKELVTNKGVLRWMDLRRLNKDSRFATTITRTVGSQIYTLLPNDPRYIFQIPDNELNGSGIEQNNR